MTPSNTPLRGHYSRLNKWIAKTVLLETQWVLRRLYGFRDDATREAFNRLLGLDNVQIEDKGSFAAALALTTHGVGLADALHLNSRPSGVTFVTFDQALVRRAKRAGETGIIELSS